MVEEALVKRLSSQKVEFDVMAKPDRYRALKEYAAVFPYLLAVWLTVFVYFQWRFRLGGGDGGGDRLAEMTAARRKADWLEASRIPEHIEMHGREEEAAEEEEAAAEVRR